MQHNLDFKPYFSFKPGDERASSFVKRLKTEVREYGINDCNVIIAIPGDGSILYSYHNHPNKPVFSVRPPNGNSDAFNGHHKIDNAIDLKSAFEGATLHKIQPLKADIEFSDSSTKTIQAYQDIVVKSFNAQAVLSNSAMNDNEPQRVMGGGWVVATPLGSTALNETIGGKIIDIGSEKMVVTINDISNTAQRKKLQQEDMMSRIVSDHSLFVAELSPKSKRREARIDFDSWSMMPDGQIYVPGKPITIDTSICSITKLSVSMDHTQYRKLLLNPEFRTPQI